MKLVMKPGEPVSVLFAERKAPFVPITLKVEMVGSGVVVLPNAAVLLSSVVPTASAPKATPVRRLPAASKTLTESPDVPLKPTPVPP